MPSVALTKLTISHFRSHHFTKLSLDSRPVAIHGPNGAGKTNILEAVSLFSPGRGLRRAALNDLIRKPEALGWKLGALLQSGTQVHELETGSEPNQPRSVKIDGKASPQIALGRLMRMVWLVPSMDRLWIEGADGRRRFFDRIAMSFEPAHAEAVLTYDKAMRERNRLLKDMVRDAHWYVALERQMAEAGHRITYNRKAALERLKAAQEGAETAFPAADLELIQAEGTLAGSEDDLLRALGDSRPNDLRAGRTLVGPHRCDVMATYTSKSAPAAQCSTGEQKALLISLVLSNARALREDTGAAPIILLDEVAAHLDADRRRALYDEICLLDCQAWMTGTGSELFDELGDRAQHLKVTEVNGRSVAEVV